MDGRLVLVVGPSGAGKDTLILAAKRLLASDPRFVFPRRVVTRPAMPSAEDHDSLDAKDFALQEMQGAYALSWRAHGLCYGIPVSIHGDIAAGRTVVINASRAAVEPARQGFQATVVLVDAAPDIRRARLAGRGREGPEDVSRRLDRGGDPLPSDTIRIDNSGSIEAGAAQFISALQELIVN